MNNPLFTGYLQRHNAFLARMLAQADVPATGLKAAMQYSLFPGGKRMRPLLVYLCGELLAVDMSTLDVIAASIELIHTYSLIHDDLPAMDNDDFRRGMPSCHRAFDEATAILAGDALHTLAFEVLLTELSSTLSALQCLRITQELLKAIGPAGMLSGQSLDLTALQANFISEAELTTIHQLKTGQLILACVNMVLLAANPSAAQTAALQQFAIQFGHVFQMQDDYLDQYATQLGKGRASDLANHKLTFTACMSQAALFTRINHEFQQTLHTLSCFAEQGQALCAFVSHLKQRSHTDKTC